MSVSVCSENHLVPHFRPASTYDFDVADIQLNSQPGKVPKRNV